MMGPNGFLEAQMGGDVQRSLQDYLLDSVRTTRPPVISQEEEDSTGALQAALREPIDGSAKYYQAAAGLLAPTRTGAFSESLGAGMSNFSRGLAEEEELQRKQALLAEEQGLRMANARSQGEQERYQKDLEAALKLRQARMGVNGGRTPWGEYTRIWTKLYEKAIGEGMPSPEKYASQYTRQVLGEALGTGSMPQGVPDQPRPRGVFIPPQGDLPGLRFEGMSTDQVRELLSRIPEPDRSQALKALMSQDQGPRAEETEPPPGLKLHDPRTRAQSKSYGSEEGKALLKEREALTDLHSANTSLLAQLNMLEHLYSQPGLPEGELAPQLQSMRSGLKSLGIEVGENVGLADMASAISTKLALAQKNAEGTNLLPGAMSNYEDQLLQKMSPTLMLTQEGRMGLIRFMKEVAASNVRIAQEGTKMAQANKDQLPAAWNSRRERVMLEEMARLKMLSEQLMGARK